jgi:hypothetical protein
VRDPVGWAILLAVAMPWYLLEYERRGDAFLAGFFMRHNVERFLAPLQGHGGSLLYYLPAILVLLLPYTGLFLRTLPGLRRGIRPARMAPLDSFLWCWFLFVFVFFSLAGTKLPHYLLYGATPLFILMARRRGDLRSNLLAFAPPLFFLAAGRRAAHAPAAPGAAQPQRLCARGAGAGRGVRDCVAGWRRGAAGRRARAGPVARRPAVAAPGRFRPAVLAGAGRPAAAGNRGRDPAGAGQGSGRAGQARRLGRRQLAHQRAQLLGLPRRRHAGHGARCRCYGLGR